MSVQLEFLTVDIAKLRPNPWNTNEVGAHNFEKLKASINKLGFFKPILVRTLEDGHYEILGGEHRWRAAVEQGRDTIAINTVGVVSDVIAKQMSIVDNERYGEDDQVALQRLVDELQKEIEYSLSEIAPFDDELAATLARTGAVDMKLLEGLFEPEEESAAIEDVRTSKERLGVDHQTMRFKVGYDVAAGVTALIERIVKQQSINTGNDSEDAGEALVWLCDHYKDVTGEK